MRWQDEQEAIAKAIASFPATFHLSSADENDLFRFSQQHSYISNNEIILYAEKLIAGQWLAFVKASVSEFKLYVDNHLQQDYN